MSDGEVLVGIDVSKAVLDVAILPMNEAFQVANDEAGWAELARRLGALAVKVVGMEPSGGYERDAARVLRRAGLPVRMVNPHRVRQFARAFGRLAKNDRIDAAMIARFAAELGPRPARDNPRLEQMKELITARRQLAEDKVRLANRLELVRDPILRRMRVQRLRRIEAEILLIEKRLKTIVAADPDLAAKDRLIQSMPGAGPVLSHTLLALIPELDDLDRREIAALAGLAPFDDDSGQRVGKRAIWGGRAEVREVVYMAALSAGRFHPTLKLFRDRLIQSGKTPKMAVIAVARRMLGIIVALLRSGQPWSLALA